LHTEERRPRSGEARRHPQGISGNQAVLFAGHSLGAALATIARRNASGLAGRAIALYTYGSPRVGDQAIYCPTYPGPAYRIVNDEDAVTHVPTPPI
jgi:predicted lipase